MRLLLASFRSYGQWPIFIGAERPQYRPYEAHLAVVAGALAFKEAHRLSVESDSDDKQKWPPIDLTYGNVVRITMNQCARKLVCQSRQTDFPRQNVPRAHRNDTERN